MPCGANLFYVYGELGGLKEIVSVSVIATAGAMAATVDLGRLTRGSVAWLALVLAALLPVLSARRAWPMRGRSPSACWWRPRAPQQSWRTVAGLAALGAMLFAVVNVAALVETAASARR